MHNITSSTFSLGNHLRLLIIQNNWDVQTYSLNQHILSQASGHKFHAVSTYTRNKTHQYYNLKSFNIYAYF